METVIKNGWIVDGTGADRYRADVLISDGVIRHIGEDIPAESRPMIDARDRCVLPGFIDTHSHSDIQILRDPALAPKIRQGITTEILGQDGVSLVPLSPVHLEEWRKNIAGLDGDGRDIDWIFTTTEGYLGALAQNGINGNAAYLAPHGNIRLEAMGWENRKATDAEIGRMQDILRREMDVGAIGLSTGLIYAPCAYSDTRELVELCKVVSEQNGVFVVHQRSEADDMIASMKEIIDIARLSGAALHISHFKICGKHNTSKIDDVFILMDRAKAEGIRISFDQYPYTAGSTALSVLLPPWALAGGMRKLLTNLSASHTRAAIKKEILTPSGNWDNFVAFAGLDGIYITSVRTKENQGAVGKNLVELGRMRGREPLDAAFDLLLEEENNVGMVDFYGDEEIVKQIMSREEQNFCTDGILAGQPHPRSYGTYPRVFEKYVKQDGLLTLEQAVHKMTGKPAAVFGFEKRGALRPGYYADIVIMDFERVAEKGTYIDPRRYPEGIETVFVNGHIVVDGETVHLPRKGMVIRQV